MVLGEYSKIRIAEPDDAYELKRLYDPSHPRSVMLDRRRELPSPTADELRESLSRNDRGGVLYAVEDREGVVRGFCTLRGVQVEMSYAEVALTLFEDGDYDTPLAAEAFAYVCRNAFVHKRLNKVISHCLDTEAGYRRLLEREGFVSNGIQRHVLWSQGGWRNLETLTLFARDKQF